MTKREVLKERLQAVKDYAEGAWSDLDMLWSYDGVSDVLSDFLDWLKESSEARYNAAIEYMEQNYIVPEGDSFDEHMFWEVIEAFDGEELEVILEYAMHNKAVYNCLKELSESYLEEVDDEDEEEEDFDESDDFEEGDGDYEYEDSDEDDDYDEDEYLDDFDEDDEEYDEE